MKRYFFFLIAISLLSTSLTSHQRSESYSKIQIDTQENLKEVEVEYSIQISVLQRLDFDFSRGWEDELINEVTEDFQFNEICESIQPPFLKNSFSKGRMTYN